MSVHDKGYRCRDPRCRCHNTGTGFMKSYVFSDTVHLTSHSPISVDNICRHISASLGRLGALCSSGDVIPGHIKAALSASNRVIASFSLTRPGKVDINIPHNTESDYILTDFSLALNIIIVGDKIPQSEILADEISSFFSA